MVLFVDPVRERFLHTNKASPFLGQLARGPALAGVRAPAAAMAATAASALVCLACANFVDRSLMLGPFVPILFALTLWAGHRAGLWMVIFNTIVIPAFFLNGDQGLMLLGSIVATFGIGLLTELGAAALRSALASLWEREAALIVAHEQQALLTRELHHRVKNLLAVVQSIVMFTLKGTTTLEGFRMEFETRLKGLARAQNAIVNGDVHQTRLDTLLDQVLAPFASPVGDDGLHIAPGPVVWIGSDLAVPLALVLHELATNASKHGALREAGSSVLCSWRMGEDETVTLEWTERNAKPIENSHATGFGTQLMERLFRNFGGVDTKLEGEGLYCALTFKPTPETFSFRA